MTIHKNRFRASICTALCVALLILVPAASQAADPVGLGVAGSYAVLAGSTITNTGPTTITGDVGLHPGGSVTGFATVFQTGELHVADAEASQAKAALITAYDDAAQRGPATTIGTELGTTIVKAGVYDSLSGTFQITGELTLDAENDPDAIFVFQMASELLTATASSVNLINGANPCNVYWQVGSSATLGTGTSFAGNIFAMESITLATGATIIGRAFARTGAVTMDTNTINAGSCAAAAPTPTPISTPTATDTPTDTPNDTPAATPADVAAPRPDSGSGSTNPTPTGSATSVAGVPVGGGGSTDNGDLPDTGAHLGRLVFAALLIITLGVSLGGLSRAARRR